MDHPSVYSSRPMASHSPKYPRLHKAMRCRALIGGCHASRKAQVRENWGRSGMALGAASRGARARLLLRVAQEHQWICPLITTVAFHAEHTDRVVTAFGLAPLFASGPTVR